MPHAVFDCDDVLANLRKIAVTRISEHVGRDITLDEMIVFDQNKLWGDKFDVNQMFKNIGLEDIEPEVGASYITNILKDKGWRTTVVTARGYHDNAKERTEKWLETHNIHIDEVIVVPLFGDKSRVLQHLGDIDFYVEDNHDHAERAHELSNVKQIYLMDRPWNKQCTFGTRVNNLEEVFIHIQKCYFL